MPPPLLYLARHAETVFNAAGRMQGARVNTPLTRRGIAQAEDMGAALAAHFGPKPDLDLWASPAGRTQQTAAIVAEHLGHAYFDVRMDERLIEIGVGSWEGRYYADIVAEQGSISNRERGLFSVRAPDGGEWYPEIAARLQAWLDELNPARTAVVISHGITARVLRGILVGGEPIEPGCVPIAPDAPQGTVFRIENGREEAIHLGTGAKAMRAL